MKRQPSDQTLTVPVCITYRLESDDTILEQIQSVLPIPVDDDIINGMHEEALLTGKSYAEIVAPFLTKAVARLLAQDHARQAHFRQIAQEHNSNILTEVAVTGNVVLPRTKGARD